MKKKKMHAYFLALLMIVSSIIIKELFHLYKLPVLYNLYILLSISTMIYLFFYLIIYILLKKKYCEYDNIVNENYDERDTAIMNKVSNIMLKAVITALIVISFIGSYLPVNFLIVIPILIILTLIIYIVLCIAVDRWPQNGE